MTVSMSTIDDINMKISRDEHDKIRAIIDQNDSRLNIRLDKMPFVERFRPSSLDGIMTHRETVNILKKFLRTHNIPHLLFYGPPGTGKTSTIEAFVKELYGPKNVPFMTMNINASEKRGIEIVRKEIKNFVSTLSLCTDKSGSPVYKFVILDEADAMTTEAQGMLKQLIESNTENARFCLICNCNKKIHPAIQSRCTNFNFPPLDYNSVEKKIITVCSNINVSITLDGMRTMWRLSGGDMRKILYMIQVISNNNKNITSKIITDFRNYPSATIITDIYKTLLTKSLNESHKKLFDMTMEHHYALTYIMTEITDCVTGSIIDKSLDPDRGTKIILKLREVEMNSIIAPDSNIQLSSFVCAFY
jgi:replication factor C subunit 3/5